MTVITSEKPGWRVEVMLPPYDGLVLAFCFFEVSNRGVAVAVPEMSPPFPRFRGRALRGGRIGTSRLYLFGLDQNFGTCGCCLSSPRIRDKSP